MASPNREARVDRLPSKLPINLQSACRGEVLPWPERRRRWSWKEKAQIVAESLAPDAVASAIARRYGLHRNQLYAWRKELREMADGGPEAARAAPLDFVPVVVTDERAVARAAAIEIELSGARVRVSPGVDPALLADVLRTLKALG
jgi:transposase